MELKKKVKDICFQNDLLLLVFITFNKLKVFFKYSLFNDKYLVSKKFGKIFGYKLNLDNPQTLNEKMQWLKLYDRKDFYTICADKYAVRDFLKENFSSDYLIPLVFHTDNWQDISAENIAEFPCIVKANHTSGDYVILRSKEDVNWKALQRRCRWWLSRDYYAISQEWQYKNIKRRIVVEKLLQTSENKIPNDYKLHYINGELQFVYVSVDREGENKRNIYDENWQPLYFSWVEKEKSDCSIRGHEIEMPMSFSLMKEIGQEIALSFKYVRIDFYDVEGKLYFGEVTLHHGGGFDVFTPDEYDLKYGNVLKL